MAASIQQPGLIYTKDDDVAILENGEVILRSSLNETGVYVDEMLDEGERGGEASLCRPLLSSPTRDMYGRDSGAASGGGQESEGLFHPHTQPLSEPKRFWQLVVGALCCLTISSSYSYNLYSGRMQSKFNFTQGEMTTISTLSDMMGILILPLGALYDHYGTKPIFILSMTLFSFSSVFFGLAFANVLSGSVGVFSIYSSMQGLGISLMDVGTVMTVLSIFPANKGAVVAVMKTFSGIGSAMIGAIHVAFFPADTDSDTSRFFYFLAVLGMVTAFLGVLFLEVPPYVISGCEKDRLTSEEIAHRKRIRKQFLKQKAPTARLAIGFAVVILLVFFLPIQGALSAYMDLTRTYHIIFVCISLGIFAFYPLMALPWSVLDRELPLPHGDGSSGRSTFLSPFGSMNVPTRETADSIALLREIEYIAPQYHTKLVQNVKTLHFWALLLAFFTVSGTQIVVMGNLRFLLGALAGEPLKDSYVAMLITAMGVASGLGRILLSALEMATQSRPAEERTPITFTLFVPTGLAVVATLLLLILPIRALPLPCFIMGLVNGSSAAAVVIVLRTIFAEDVAKHYNFCSIASISASLLMNRIVYGEWYTYKAEAQHSTLCYGRQCVVMPIVFCLVSSIIGVMAVAYGHWHYSKYCHTMLEKRARRLAHGKARATSHPVNKEAMNSDVNREAAVDDTEKVAKLKVGN